jgi:hypothetical protein
MVNTFGIVLAGLTFWWIDKWNLSSTCTFGLVELRQILQKGTFHPIFSKSFSFFENIFLDTWIDTQSAPTHVQPSNFN